MEANTDCDGRNKFRFLSYSNFQTECTDSSLCSKFTKL